MTDKTDRLIEVLEHPERFSDEELDRLLADPEIRKTYEVMSRTTDALTAPGEFDMESEWEAFSSKFLTNKKTVKPSRPHRFVFPRHAAAVTIGVIGSLAVIAVVSVGIKHIYDTRPSDTSSHIVTEVEESLTTQAEISVEPESADTLTTYQSSEEIIFKDRKLKEILSSIAQFYGANVIYLSDRTLDLRLFFKWDKSSSLEDVVNRLNSFSKINLVLEDNTITVE